MDWSFGTAALIRTFYILSKYFTQGSQNNLQLAYCKEVYRHSNWNTLGVFLGEAPAALSYLTNKPCTQSIILFPSHNEGKRKQVMVSSQHPSITC